MACVCIWFAFYLWTPFGNQVGSSLGLGGKPWPVSLGLDPGGFLTCTWLWPIALKATLSAFFRYVYHSSQWMVAGNTDHSCITPRFYVHPHSPCSGDTWMQQIISFDGLKLTNNEMDDKGHVSVWNPLSWGGDGSVKASSACMLPWRDVKCFSRVVFRNCSSSALVTKVAPTTFVWHLRVLGFGKGEWKEFEDQMRFV